MKVLVTGGAGYIGTHCLVELIQAGIEPVVLDNLSNSDPSALDRVEQITGQTPIFIEGDIRDHRVLELTFQAHRPRAVLHLAGLKAVGESVEKPLEYYDNNIAGTLQLLHTMREYQCRQIVFSSSATVYGDPQTLPIPESAPIGGTTNPYGTSKYMIERILADWAHADPQAQVIALRYFNPVGAHPSGLIGEDPKGLPNNLMPFIQKVAVGELEQLSVFGNDYDTEDGTGVRDYLHVVDLAKGHLAAIQRMQRENDTGFEAINLGTGNGISVLQMVHAFERASAQTVAYQIAPRRPGDIAACYADASCAWEKLNWRAELDLTQMCQDAWRWQQFIAGK